MKVIVGAAASNAHLYQVGQAVQEMGALSRYLLPFGGWPLRHPLFFSRRRPAGISPEKLSHFPAWEFARLAAAKARLPDPWIDLIWERAELYFDGHCARAVSAEIPDAFLGVEHGALAALRAAKQAGSAAGLVFTSLHHAFRKRWLDPELERFPELLSPSSRSIRARDAARDERRDEEMRASDFIHANSETTARSLREAGYPADRILTVPLGCPAVPAHGLLAHHPPSIPTVIFVGNIALHKGAHHLLEAWRKVASARKARLDLYGSWHLPESFRPAAGENITLHGRVSPEAVRDAMRSASILVLPSVCDGFGMVVSEAMAQGLPVICSRNAGACQLVVDGVNGFSVAPADPDGLAAKLLWTLEHPADLLPMGRAAAQTAKEWSWAHFRSEFASKLSTTVASIRR